MKFPASDNWPRWELWVRPEAAGGKWAFLMSGAYQEVLAAMGGAGLEYSIRRHQQENRNGKETRLCG